MFLLTKTLQLGFCAVACGFAAYVLLELRLALLAGRSKEGTPPPSGPEGEFCPRVAVLLPVCDESAVIEGLVRSVGRLEYPRDRLDVLLLDDSADAASELARSLVAEQAAGGLAIRYLNRGTREGFKAGNLSYGVARTDAEFLAVFDADFIPPPDFLRLAIPRFRDPGLGFIQTAISFRNRESSFLTRFQAQEMEHGQFVTAGLSLEEDMVSLSGSSCVWRRSCLEAIGGWRAATATEDADIGYQAQLAGWKGAFAGDVVSSSLLPETAAAFRSQRERWGRGLMRCAFLHRRRLGQKKLPPLKRLHAAAMMFSSLLLAAIYGLFLLCLPLTALGRFDGAGFAAVALAFFVLVAVWAVACHAGTPAWDDLLRGRIRARTLAQGYAYVALFLPMSLYYFAGGARALFGAGAEFRRTPKGSDELREPRSGLDAALRLGELFSFLYAAAIVAVAAFSGNIVLMPVGLTACLGFGLALFQDARDGRRAGDPGRAVLITGATGALGSALAKLYAGPGALLMLQGRDPERLASLAGDCRAKGASVLAHGLDLRDDGALRSWLEDMEAAGPPDLILPAAGANASLGPEGEPEDQDEADGLIDLNVRGTMKVVAAFLPGMIRRGGGQIAVFSSQAGRFGLPLTPSYCASKAALKAWGESLRGWLAPRGVRVSVIMPGYVKSRMCDGMPGPKPFLWAPDRAARAIRAGLGRDRARVSFPFPLNAGTWLLGALPAAVSHRILGWLGYAR
jgi:cellulose synthase (UDP-forming)